MINCSEGARLLTLFYLAEKYRIVLGGEGHGATEADTEADTEYTVQAGGEGHGAIVLSPPTDRAGGGRKL